MNSSGEILKGDVIDADSVAFAEKYAEDIRKGNMYNVACTLSGRLRQLDKKTRKTNERADRLEAENKAQEAKITALTEALERIANTYDDSWRLGSQERSMGDLARKALE